MIRLFCTTALTATLAVGTVQAATYTFSQDGYDGGGVFSGTFEAEDLNGDNQIVSFENEIFDLFATYEGIGRDGSVISTTFDFNSFNGPGLTGLVLDLNGEGTIGDGNTGAIEGFALDNGTYYIAVGQGPASLCDGINDCGFIQYSGPGVPVGLPDEEIIVAQAVMTNDLPETEQLVLLEGEPFIGSLATSSQAINIVSGPTGEPFSIGTAENPFMPIDDDSDGFTFNLDDLEIRPFETFFIDPEIAVGYTYTITGSTFFSVTAPTLGQVNDDDGQYTLTADGVLTTLLAGETYFFGDGTSISEFSLTDIGVTPGLDPNDPLAFQTGVSVSTFTGSVTITQTPIVEEVNLSPVPVPAGGLLLGSGLFLLGAYRRRKT